MTKKFYENNLSLYQKFNDYLRQTVLEANKLSEDELGMLCSEYCYWANKAPNPYIKTGIFADAIAYCDCRFQYFWERLVNIINQYTENQSNIYPWTHEDFDINPVKDLKLMLPFDTEYLYHRTGCGSLNMRFYKLIYYFDFLGIPIQNLNLKLFWKFYKKTMAVYAMGLHYYSSGRQEVHVILKPDELFIKDNITHCIYNGIHYCDGVSVPAWLYNADKENLDTQKFSDISNADYRSIFIKKAGIEKFLKMGELIDSYKNYPENEWWVKSEYKLIDMRKILAKKVEKNVNNGKTTSIAGYNYAPYLCMKNQTTGECHLEGVSPECKNLYDALKMRYKMLNLTDYEIKNIK